MDIDQVTFCVFFVVAAVIAANSALRIYQRPLHDVGLAITRRKMERKQRISAMALTKEKDLVDRKQQIVDSLVDIMSSPSTPAEIVEEERGRRDLESIDEEFDAYRAKVTEELARIDHEAEEELERHRRRRRPAVVADVALLVLSLSATVALVVAALPAFS
jgi:vacuolar-type H+-ATPase subunit E/Vma4